MVFFPVVLDVRPVSWYPQYATPYGHFAHPFAVESTLHGAPASSAHLGKDGMPLPPGITRPKPQAVGITAQSLISEMAGQMGRLSALATEVRAPVWLRCSAVLLLCPGVAASVAAGCVL